MNSSLRKRFRGGTSKSGRLIQHVNSFGDSEGSVEEEKTKDFEALKPKKIKKKKSKKKKNKKQILEGAL